MHTGMKTTIGSKATVLKMAFLIATVSVFTLAFTAQADAVTVPSLPAPVVTGVSPGEVLNTDAVDLNFDLAGSLSGGTLLNFLCSLDGAPFTVCTSPASLVGLSAGVHDYQVKGVVQLAGGTPVCILGICVDPGPVTVETDPSNLTFSVDLGGTSIGSTGATGTPGGGGSNGTNGANGAAGATTTNAAAIAALKKQTNRCTKLKRKLHKHFSKRSNRLRAKKRYTRCIKVQRKLAKKVASS